MAIYFQFNCDWLFSVTLKKEGSMMRGVSRFSGGITRARKVEVAKLFKELFTVQEDKLALLKSTQAQISIWDRQNPSSEVKCTQASLSAQTLRISHSCRIFWSGRSIWQQFRWSIWRQFGRSIWRQVRRSIWQEVWRSIWQEFWRSIWHLFWRSISATSWRQVRTAAKAATCFRTRGILQIGEWYGYISLRFHSILQFIDDPNPRLLRSTEGNQCATNPWDVPREKKRII